MSFGNRHMYFLQPNALAMSSDLRKLLRNSPSRPGIAAHPNAASGLEPDLGFRSGNFSFCRIVKLKNINLTQCDVQQRHF